jgi:hypothetical protein
MIARVLGLVVSLSTAAAVLASGMWAGGAFAPARAAGGPPSRATDELAYAHDGEIPVGDALEVNGQPLQLSLFYTSDDPGRVVRFYAEAFQARHMVPVASTEDRIAHVSAFDPDDGLQRFINAVAQPDGQTLVMVGVTNPRKPPRLLNGAGSASFPVPDENRAFLGYRSEDAGSRAESAQFVTAQSPAQVAEFYRKALGAGGWTENKGESSESMLIFAKDGETLSVALQALDEKKGAAVFVNKLSGGVR